MGSGVVRTLKGGGCSICRAAEQNVGKRRCQHVLDNATMNVERARGLTIINIEGQVDGKNTNFSIEASNTEIKNYMTNLSKGLSTKERNSVLAVLRGE